MSVEQLNLMDIAPDGPCALAYFSESDGESRGEIFTKREVAEFILDLVGWGSQSDLSAARLLEPSVGSGDFLLPAIERLLSGPTRPPVSELVNRIRAIEVNRDAYNLCRLRISELLARLKFSKLDRDYLLDAWLIHGDFLAIPLEQGFTHVVGNPPYLRQESLPDELLKRYRKMYHTMFDRADLYVPFFERGLSLLAPEGKHGFICADRWMKNKYGGPLREMVARDFALDYYTDFTGCPAFHGDVVAYPAVTVIRRGTGNLTKVARRPEINSEHLTALASAMINPDRHPDVTTAIKVIDGNSPWLLDSPERLNVIRDIESRFSPLEQVGCAVGIGVASGLDKVYIRSDDELPVEESRKIRIASTREVKDGKIHWTGKMLLNPFDGDSPRLVNPEDYPLFKAYLELHREAIEGRHVAKKNPTKWFKTIDRIYPTLTTTPKLLIPDIKGEPTVVYDTGEFYPHHNFYYITSETWDLEALQAILLSPVTQAFIATYSLRMRGDCLRYQAQYLRRIRLPDWESIAKPLRKRLTQAGRSQDPLLIRKSVQEAYQLSDQDWICLEENP